MTLIFLKHLSYELLLKIFLNVCVYANQCVNVTHVCAINMLSVCTSMCAYRDQRGTLSNLLYDPLPYSFETGLLTEPETSLGAIS